MQPVEMALEVALLVMQNGGSTVAAERSFSKILTGYQAEGVSAIWRLDFIAAPSTAGGQTSTVVRTVGPIGVNLVRAAEVSVLSERVAKGEVAIDGIGAEVERIRNLPSPYNRLVSVAAATCVSTSFSQLLGGDWGGLVVVLVAASVGQFLRSLMQARNFAVDQVTLTCGLLSASFACVGLRLGFSQIVTAVLISSVIYLSPGLPLINGFIDVASHKYMFVGVERIAKAMVLFLIMALAVALAFAVIL